MKRTSYFILLLIIILQIGGLFSSSYANAHHQDIHSSIYQYMRLIQEDKHTEAELLINQHKLELYEYAEKHASEKDLPAIMSVITKNVDTIAANNADKREKYIQAMSMLLVFDALKSEEAPLWLQWKQEFQKELKALMAEEILTDQSVEKLAASWDIIEPALQIMASSDDYQAAKDEYQHFMSLSSSTVWKQQLAAVDAQLNLIDIKNDEKLKRNLTLIFMLVAVGGFITITLSYVAWKKYKGEKSNDGNKSENN
ncbi:sporulation protein YpjB [Sediminibacillus albus]|uniref:Sporulation protein YpjB n=1 Tax=Sediminibacillus albus TaxID=407036 RepID=A0A1G8VQK2_9BACI|nr:sporulation protein YpjB [Sediminibacillus albus]SDJ67695.1 sporulation protein YpjB [Sediminibacillus albus]